MSETCSEHVCVCVGGGGGGGSSEYVTVCGWGTEYVCGQQSK